MSLNRRKFIKLAGLGLGGALLSPQVTLASEETTLSLPKGADAENQAAMLYDTTKCTGCRACQTACKEWNGNRAEPDSTGLYDTPTELSADTWTLIKLYEGSDSSFIKRQCMHCLEPACASVCPVGAFRKTAEGAVVYDGHKCIGCRYCMMACPFRVPKYEWNTPVPLIRKCTFCADRQAEGMEPACTEICPTGALLFGSRGELLAEAHKRIQDHPDKYVDHVYGEHEAGGTLGLYLSHVPFKELGFPTLDTRAITAASETAMIAVPGVIVGAVSILSGLYQFTKRREESEVKAGEEK
ncbi:MAG: hydrogenase 2 operon protein HybA [Chloroflexi bacterium]|nr:hydrogenase 2 operon protein HybA [Chloroflexota bacterium]